ncbi:hypothetical protein J2X83_000943 [Brevibacillus nitrificans]|nr:hypothetical protein [Brevibacillus nitrificans]
MQLHRSFIQSDFWGCNDFGDHYLSAFCDGEGAVTLLLITKVVLALLLLKWVGAEIIFSPSSKKLTARVSFFIALVVISGAIYWIGDWF